MFFKNKISVLEVELQRKIKYHIKCGVITHSTKETRQQKEHWWWGLEVTGKCGGERGGGGGGSEWVGQYLKKVGRHPFLHYKTNPSPHSWLRRGRGMGSHYVNARVTTQKTRKLHRKVFRKINESTWGTSSWIKQLWNTRSVSTQL